MKNTCVRKNATAVLRGNDLAPHLRGTVRFIGTPCGTQVVAKLCGLPPSDTGFFGFHVHAKGCCDSPDYSSALGHYDPEGVAHPKHAGDLPMLLAADRGDAYLSFVTTRFRVCDVIGRAVVIHSGRDDYTSQPGGDAGSRIACGVIR